MKTNQRQSCKVNLALLLSLAASMAVAQEITVMKVTGTLPTDPFAPTWQQVPAKNVQVMPQQMTMPRLEKGSIHKLTAQAVTNGDSIAWRVSWQDTAPDFNVDTGRFSDAVALEFPLTKNPAPFMGHRGGGKVQILYWKGLWQKDIDEGFQDVQDVHPNAWSDLYWFAEGKPPHSVPEDFQDPRSHQWFIAKQAGNPGAVFNREQPVQELVATGWGTLTPQPESVTMAQGIWKDNHWTLVFSRPLTTDDPNDHQFKLGKKGDVAFAIWQGGDGNRGGRKHWTAWIHYQMP